MAGLTAEPIGPVGEVGAGDSVAELILAAAESVEGAIVCISQKVVSKAEGRARSLDAVEPGPRAQELGERLGKDPELVELILAQSARVVRAERGVLITETHSGLICANAGIDASNVPGERRVLLLPEDPDASARSIRAELGAEGRCAVLITDSLGRPWRLGQCEVAIGCAGINPLDDLRGSPDSHGMELKATAIATADQLAAASDLARGKTSGTPFVLLHGASSLIIDEDGPGAAALIRPADEDLFR